MPKLVVAGLRPQQFLLSNSLVSVVLGNSSAISTGMNLAGWDTAQALGTPTRRDYNDESDFEKAPRNSGN